MGLPLLDSRTAPTDWSAAFFTYARKYGTYMRAWLGWKGGLEPEPCIIRRFADRPGDISFQPEAWTELDKRLKSVRPVQQAPTTQGSLPSTRSSSQKRTAPRRSVDTRQTKRHQAEANDNAHSSSEDTDSSDGDEDTEDESDEEDNENTRTGASHRQLQQKGSGSNLATPDLSRGPELVFKLTFFRFTVQHARDSPLEECKTSKALFEKARALYKIFDRDAKVDALTCQLATRPEQHYLFAGNEGE
ncbi:uncharacterized protein BDV17DRAFT_295333 [Aspergillus undulatus]|uniref:uncharacterized protein n=1 Tax=Aspergillus undulatus TaxID=1810928 RepID=UPI003CCE1E3C